MTDPRDMRRLVDGEFASIGDSSRRAELRSTLVSPQALSLAWDYGTPGEQFECWLIGFSKEGKKRLIYCDRGFGPAYPWGIVGAKEDGMGMDCQWHVGLEHAAIAAGILEPPPDYEVP
jgi:hypothetical protein